MAEQDFFSNLKDLNLALAKKYIKVRYPSHFIYWERNAEKLLKDYKGDPLEIISSSLEKSLQKLQEFKGFGIKQAKMYLIFLLKYNIIKNSEWIYEIGPAIDSHLIKISARCGIFDFKEGIRIDRISKELDKLYSTVTKEEKLNSIVLDECIWVIGSKLCTNYCSLCPLTEICNREELKIKKARIYKKSEIKRFLFKDEL